MHAHTHTHTHTRTHTHNTSTHPHARASTHTQLHACNRARPVGTLSPCSSPVLSPPLLGTSPSPQTTAASARARARKAAGRGSEIRAVKAGSRSVIAPTPATMMLNVEVKVGALDRDEAIVAYPYRRVHSELRDCTGLGAALLTKYLRTACEAVAGARQGRGKARQPALHPCVAAARVLLQPAKRAGRARAAFAYQTAVPAVVTAHKKGECTLALLALWRILVRLPHGRRLCASAETRPSVFAPQRGRLADATPAQCSRAEWQGGGTTDHAGCRRLGGEALHTPTWRGRETSPPTDDIPPFLSPCFWRERKKKKGRRETRFSFLCQRSLLYRAGLWRSHQSRASRSCRAR